MSGNLPYMNAHGTLPDILRRIKDAQTPPRFTHDFLAAKLGVKSSGARAVIPLLKRIGFLGSDGAPTEMYRRFRNPAQSGAAMAEGIRAGYADLYASNEYAHELSKAEIEGLVMQITGLKKGDQVLRYTVGTFDALKSNASFQAEIDVDGGEGIPDEIADRKNRPVVVPQPQFGALGMNLGYTVNLNLPETTNIAVYEAIFQSLKRHLLGN